VIYYFHLWNGNNCSSDKEGSDLPDSVAAMQEARQAAREIAANQLRSNQPVDGHRIEVVDENGVVVGTVSVREVLG
jgi:hypothetical protein